MSGKDRRQVDQASYCKQCPPGSTPYFSILNTCGCKKNGVFTPDPDSQLPPPYIIGAVNKRQASSSSACPTNIVCGAGCDLDPDTCTCHLNAKWPLDACRRPPVSCEEGHHAVYNQTSGGCPCMIDCPDLTSCTGDLVPFYNSFSHICSCQNASSLLATVSVVTQAPPITSDTSPFIKATPPPLPTNLPTLTGVYVGPPKPVTRPHTYQTLSASLALPPFYQTLPVASPPLATASVSPGSPSVAICAGILDCIAEMTPYFNSEEGVCQCKWIEGFGPDGTKF